MSFAQIFLWLMLLLSIGLTLLVTINDYKSRTSRFFTAFVISVIFWIISNYLANEPGTFALFWTKFTYFSAGLISILLFYFALSFPKPVSIKKIINVATLAVSLVLLPLTLFSDMIVIGVEEVPYGTLPIFGEYFYLWAAFFVLFMILSFFVLFKKMQHSTGNELAQIKTVFWGLLLSGTMGIAMNLVLPFLGVDSLVNYGPYSMIILLIFTSIAILKYQMLNIKIITTESLVIAINIALLFNVLYSENIIAGIIRFLILIISSFIGYLLVKSVLNEIQQKEKLQELTIQLGQANAHLQELDKMKTEFVSLASHELLTPVSAIEGYLSMVLDEKLVEVTDPKLAQYLDRVYRSAKRLARLISDMLNISRIEEGRLLVQKEDVEVADLIRQVVDEIKFKAEEHKQKVVFESTEKFPSYADPEKIKEVVVNLVGNSIKYSKDPGTIHVRVEKVPTALIVDTWNRIENEIKARPLDDQEAIKSAADPHMRELVGDQQYLIHVKDEGIGIPKDELPRLFKKFHRVGDYTTAESQGTGLGLYISRALVELNHGRIWADSEGEGKGSTFSFSLPDIAVKQQIIELEKEVPQDKEQLKPLAKPMGNDEQL